MAIAIGQEIGSYRVEALLGQGGQAEVWRVRHRTLDSLAALKVLRVTSESLERRLVQEGRVQASLRHPNIVSVLDVVQIEGALGLLLEFVDGPSLEHVLTERRVALPEALDWFRGILAAVEVAHQQGIVHRDLKPANVLLAPVSGALLPKVADFGLARILDEAGSGTRANSAMGTLEYMAPEQVSDARSVDARADIFALGCMFYELVATQRPFAAPNLLGYYRAIERKEYTPPCAQVPGLPAHFDEVVAGCLAFEREDRFGTIAALRTALYPTVSVFASIGGDDGLAAVVPARAPAVSTPGAATYNPAAESFHEDVGSPAVAAASAVAAPGPASEAPRGPESLLDAALPAKGGAPAGDAVGRRFSTRARVATAALVVCALLAWWVKRPAVLPVDPAPAPALEAAASPTPPPAVGAPPTAPALEVAAPAPAVSVPAPAAATPGASAVAPAAAKPTPVATATHPPAPAAAATTPTAAAVAPEVPSVPPASAPPPSGPRASFSTDGNFAVRFEAGGASFQASQPLPPGDYDITADFGDGRKVAGHATVVEGASLVVRCQPGGGRCVAR